jgi:hypothetical protein
MAGTAEYNVVFGYADRPFAVVHLGCGGVEQSGAVRYGGYDTRNIFTFWGLPKTGVPGKHPPLPSPSGTGHSTDRVTDE